MASLSFDGETHDEIVRKIRRYLASIDNPEATVAEATDVIEQGAALTKDALRIIAAAAPAPIARNEVVKRLTEMGYQATDATKTALVEGLDALETVSGGSVVKQARQAGRKAMYEMNSAVAKQILKSFAGK